MLDAARALQQQLDKEVRQIGQELVLFGDLTALDATSAQSAAITPDLESALAAIMAEQVRAASAAKHLREREGEPVLQLGSLCNDTC